MRVMISAKPSNSALGPVLSFFLVANQALSKLISAPPGLLLLGLFLQFCGGSSSQICRFADILHPVKPPDPDPEDRDPEDPELGPDPDPLFGEEFAELATVCPLLLRIISPLQCGHW